VIDEAIVATPDTTHRKLNYLCSGSPTNSIYLFGYRLQKPADVRRTHGLLRDVSLHASALLVEGNLEPHHHLVCTRRKAVQDIEGDFINFNGRRGRRRAAVI
jgi:hypothetical protein